MVQQGEGISVNESEIRAMIDLLDETDSNSITIIDQKLRDQGSVVLPFLLDAIASSITPVKTERLKILIDDIHFQKIKRELQDWTKSEKPDLLEGYLLLSTIGKPELETNQLRKEVHHLVKDVWLELNDHLTALEKIRVLNHVLYQLKGFETQDSKVPESLLLPLLLKSKSGSPLSIGILYLIISQQLSLPVFGVDLPHHFVLSYLDKNLPQINEKDISYPVMFYINPFNKGIVFTEREVGLFLEQMNLQENDNYYNPCDNNSIIKRLINELKNEYKNLKNKSMEMYLNELSSVL
ncbi:MAG: transglutaminase family protein [Bacteroidales bacterium]|nr:transglutaminase family protein [Bacteroidales bacterium]